MGYAMEDPPVKRLPPLKEINQNKNTNLNPELEARVENSIMTMLQQKCSELGKEAEENKAAKRQIEIENSMLLNKMGEMERV